MEYRYTAIVLAKRDVGETDRLYALFTREAGKVVARGVSARKPRAKLAPHLETGMLSSVSVMRTRGMGRIASAIGEEVFVPDSFDVAREILRALSTVDRVVGEGERDEKLFDLLVSFLAVMRRIAREGKDDRAELLGAAFSFAFLERLGGGMQVQVCAECGARLEGERFVLGIESGGVLCASCRHTERSGIVVDRDAVKLLRVFSEHSFLNVAKIRPTPRIIRQVRSVLDRSLERMLK